MAVVVGGSLSAVAVESGIGDTPPLASSPSLPLGDAEGTGDTKGDDFVMTSVNSAASAAPNVDAFLLPSGLVGVFLRRGFNVPGL